MGKYRVFVVCVVFLASAARAEAESVAEPTPGEGDASEESFLGVQLREAGTEARAFRWAPATVSTSIGITATTLGIVRLVQDPADNQIERGAGLMWLSIGAVSLTTGLLLFIRKAPEEDVLRRWNEARASGRPLSEYELGSFAGELRAAAKFRKRERNLVRWTSLAGAGAGVLSMSLIPAADNLTSSSRRNILVIGSILSGVGLLNFGLSFQKTGAELAWESYQGSTSYRRRSVQASVAPTAFRRGGGLMVTGCF